MFRTTAKSQTLLLNELTRNLQAEGRKIYKFGFGESPFQPPAHVIEAFQSAAHRTDYTPVQGLPELRENVAKFHSRTHGYAIQPQQVVIGSGSKILLYDTLLAFQSAVVVMPAPAWVSYKPQADLAGHQTHVIPTDYAHRWRIQPEVLDEILSLEAYQSLTKILIINYPGNPDGLTYSSDELKDITRVLRKHDAWVIADEIYALLHHDGTQVSIASHYPERTMITTGLSKWCGAGGWRLGVEILPPDAPELTNAVIGLASETYSCAPAPMQVAATAAYQWNADTENHLQNQRRILSTMGYHIHQQLAESGIAVHPPEGAFYLLLDFSTKQAELAAKGIATDVDLCSTLLAETGVALLPGSAFGNATSNLTARLAYVDFDGEAALHDITKNPNAINNLLETHSSHMLEGIQALVDWVN